MLYYTTTRVSLIPRLSRTLRSEESRYAPRHDTLGGLSKQEWGEIAENFKVMDMTYEISDRNARFEKSQARMEALFTRMEASFQSSMQKLAFLKNLKLIKNNDNALPKTKPLYSHIKLENYVHAA
jgi:hypothetical protein